MQLAGEFAEFFPNNAVEYIVSYYDYYQPEAYVPRTDTFIEKDAQVNVDVSRAPPIYPQGRLRIRYATIRRSEKEGSR